MNKNKLVIVIGTRPQIIKSANFIKKIYHSNLFNIKIINSNQHYDDSMFNIFVNEYDIKSKIKTIKINNKKNFFIEFSKKLNDEISTFKPKLLINFGDTTTTLISALIAYKNNIFLAHIESGLRSYNYNQPEEKNRKITDHLSHLRFCPTKTSLKNLKSEGLIKNSFFYGDLMFENFLKLKSHQQLKNSNIKFDYYLLTIHRAENLNKIKLKIYIDLINKNNKLNLNVVLPIHHSLIKFQSFIKKYLRNVEIIKPVNHINSLNLIKFAKVIYTDSGGLQKECHFLNKKCVILREETEWVESIFTGNSRLYFNKYFKKNKKSKNIYGDKNVSLKIIKEINNFLNIKSLRTK